MQTLAYIFNLLAFVMIFEIALSCYLYYRRPSLQNLHRTLGFAIMGFVATFTLTWFNLEPVLKEANTFAVAMSVTTVFVSLKFLKKIRHENYLKFIA